MVSLRGKAHMNAALLILSDKGSQGKREDKTGPQMRAWLQQRRVEVDEYTILADEEDEIVAYLCAKADASNFDLIITCGGTGVAPRDRTPDATIRVVERQIPGMAEAMRRVSAEKTPAAMLSRAVVGIRNTTLILNVPGNPGAAQENLEAVWDAIPHAVAKIQGDLSDCEPQ